LQVRRKLLKILNPGDRKFVPGDGKCLPADRKFVPGDGKCLPADRKFIPGDGKFIPGDLERFPAYQKSYHIQKFDESR